MGTIRLAATECNYKELHRKLKEKFLHGFNESDMLAEIIRELTKTYENILVTSEQALVWAKRIEAQIALAAVIKHLSEKKLCQVQQDEPLQCYVQQCCMILKVVYSHIYCG